jgi:hypothetical protein
MIDAAINLTALPRIERAKPATITLPKPVAIGAPVLISDCNSPLAGDTLLGLLWKRMDASNGPDPD